MASRRRQRQSVYWQALPPYLGGKRKLLGTIARALPRPSDAPVMIDAFLGGGSVSLMAKARGYRVICNDVALRSAAVGRALIANDRVTISAADITRLFVPDGASRFIESGFSGEVLPAAHARFLDGALSVARKLGGAKGALLTLLLIRYILSLRPMGNFGAKTVMRQLSEGRWDEVNEAVLRESFTRRIQSHPRTLCRELATKINAGVFSNGCVNECHELDVFEFLQSVQGSVAYFDPPYGGTVAYETAMRPLDSMLAGEHVETSPSTFSGRDAVETLERLLEAASHIPHWVISYGNAVLTPAQLSTLVGKFKTHVTVDAVRYNHLAALSNDREKNLEILITAH